MLSCNELVLNYAVAVYDKTKSKVEIVKEIAGQLTAAPTEYSHAEEPQSPELGCRTARKAHANGFFPALQQLVHKR